MKPSRRYPPVSDALTAGEWNRVRLANNRVEVHWQATLNAEPTRGFLPPRLLRSAHLQTMVGSVLPRSWLIRRRADALLARARRWCSTAAMACDCRPGTARRP